MTKRQMVINHLNEYKKISSWEAIQNYRATRLADIIFSLRADGMTIITEMIPAERGSTTYAVYHLVSSDEVR